MRFDTVPLGREQAAEWSRLLEDPSLAFQFDVLREPGQIAHALDDPYAALGASFLLRADGAPAAFCQAFEFPQADGARHAMLRLGVGERFRRRGLGSALLARATAALAGRVDGVDLAAWHPVGAAEAFAAHHGARPVRTFWRMIRPPGPVPDPAWPAGITVRTFDHTEARLAEWLECYNDSFAEHWRFIPGTLEGARQISRDPLFLPDGLMLAYRDGRCVGFSRNDPVGDLGLVATLGTARAARGIGLGRALLRASIAYWLRRGAARVGLLVDGENESALALYRSEGFAVERTRTSWELAIPARPDAAVGGRAVSGPEDAA